MASGVIFGSIFQANDKYHNIDAWLRIYGTSSSSKLLLSILNSLCKETIHFAIAISIVSLQSSVIIKNKSNLDINGGLNLILDFKFLVLSYQPIIGFIAAKIEHLAFKVAYIPALVIDIVYYSIASWIATVSLSIILSNSSIQHIPLSANINAPASKV